MDRYVRQTASRSRQAIRMVRLVGTSGYKFAREFSNLAVPPFYFTLLTLAITWPAARIFTTHYLGANTDDPRHNLWFIWHVFEALRGRQPLYEVSLLYYPRGVSLLTHSDGPVMGILALPFWPWGLVAAHNGAILLGFALTGYAMYLLARGLGFNRLVSLFAGTLFLASPIHILGAHGHMGKSVLGLIPLALLAVHEALRPRRSSLWVVLVAVVLLLNLLHNGLHYIESVLAVAFFVVVAFLRAPPVARRPVFRRALLIAAMTLILTGPLLLATYRAARQPGLQISASQESFDNQPDIVEFVLPPPLTRLFGGTSAQLLTRFDAPGTIETAVFLSWVGLLLCLVALHSGHRDARVWLLFTAAWVVLSMGPTIRLLGHRTFTAYNVPIILPYAFFTSLPGMDFLRTPGRFMFMGFAGFAIAASYGLAALHARYPRAALPVTAGAIILVLLETWPQPLPRMSLPDAPPFYRQLAGDPEMYGLFDLPVNPRADDWYVGYSSHYQLDQTVHGKGIASGYIPRTYASHPLFACLIPELRLPTPDLLLDGEPVACYRNALYDLAYHNYRYVVWHKPGPHNDYSSDPAEVEATSAFLLGQFAGQDPLVDDDRVLVYAVPPLADIPASLTYGYQFNWHELEEGGTRRWARSPATLFISTPHPQKAILEITPENFYDPGTIPPVRGDLHLALDDTFVTTLPLEIGQTAAAPLEIPAGFHTLSLELQAGNFRPSDSGSDDTRWLSFAVKSLNLVTQLEP